MHITKTLQLCHCVVYQVDKRDVFNGGLGDTSDFHTQIMQRNINIMIYFFL